jgi:tripartite ATP-independent transporter DctM subunit
MGSIYFGIATPTEAASFGALAALLVGVLMRRLGPRTILSSTWEAVKTNCMILIIVGSAMYFTTFVAISALPFKFGDLIISMELGRWEMIGILTGLYLILGMLMDGISMQVLTMPILFNTVIQMGFDPIWFGIYVTLMIEIAQITPPVGINLYVIGSIVPDRPMTDTIKAVIPFFCVITADIVVLMLFPQLALFLPSLM